VSGTGFATSDFRAPIFYDSDNTGYYLDPAGTSNLNQLTTNTRAKWNMPRWWMSREDYTSDQNYWTGTNGWGTSGGTWANAWRGGFSGWDIWGSGTDHPQGGGYVHAQGIVSGQHLATSDGGSGYGWMMVGAADAVANRYWLRGKWSTTTSGWVEMITTGNIGGQSVSYANTAGSAPANGGNSSTVGGYSVAVGGSANTIPTRNGSGYLIPENWIQLNGFYGLYSPNNNAHFYPNNGTYGAFRMDGSRNNWGGIEFINSGNGAVVLMINNSSNTTGFHNNSYGWQFYWEGGVLYVSKNAYGGGTTATVIDSTNIGSYTAGNVNNISSAVGGGYTWTGLNYFRTNLGGYCGSLANAPLQAYSDSNNSAFFSFHKGGHYAVNMGLDADNVLRIGGWSAAANRWQLDMSGNMTVAGDVTAFSDARVKTNVQTIENALEKTLSLRGVTYNRTDSEDVRTKVGVIAQEIIEVLPEVVNQDNDGMYSVSYGNITALLIEAIKEQQLQIEELKTKLDAFTK
jgi:hypothetical protein